MVLTPTKQTNGVDSNAKADRATQEIWRAWFEFYTRHFRGAGIAISAADQMAFYEIAGPILRKLAGATQETKEIEVQHSDQHTDAIQKTIQVKNEVSASIFDDKVKPMGFVTVSKGKIAVTLDYLPSMISDLTQRDFIVDAIGLALARCYDANAAAFDPHAVR